MYEKGFLGPLLTPISLSPNIVQIFLALFFFLSGVTALLYQLIWQRILYQIFSVDLLSVTIIISVFMFGLGVGALLGGYLVDKFGKQLLMIYVFLEALIAGFGCLSPQIISAIPYLLSPLNLWMVAGGSFLLLAIPTILMGATFPVLVAHVYKRTGNMGASVGLLYFVNTLGGSVGAYFAGFVLLSSLTLSQALYETACLNISIAMCAYLIFRKQTCFKPAH